MKSIKEFDTVINNDYTICYDEAEAKGFNITLLCAYRDSKEVANDTVNFYGFIRDYDVKPIVESLRAQGFKSFTISGSANNFLETIAKFEEMGCELAGTTTMKIPFEDNRTNDWQTILALRIWL